MHDFLRYVEDSSDKFAEKSNSSLVKHIHEKVKKVRSSANMEVEYMTLLERDREKIEEGIELTKKIFKMSIAGMNVSDIAKECGISEEEVEKILR